MAKKQYNSNYDNWKLEEGEPNNQYFKENIEILNRYPSLIRKAYEVAQHYNIPVNTIIGRIIDEGIIKYLNDNKLTDENYESFINEQIANKTFNVLGKGLGLTYKGGYEGDEWFDKNDANGYEYNTKKQKKYIYPDRLSNFNSLLHLTGSALATNGGYMRNRKLFNNLPQDTVMAMGFRYGPWNDEQLSKKVNWDYMNQTLRTLDPIIEEWIKKYINEPKQSQQEEQPEQQTQHYQIPFDWNSFNNNYQLPPFQYKKGGKMFEWKPKKFQDSGEIELSENDREQQHKQQRRYFLDFYIKDIPSKYIHEYPDGSITIETPGSYNRSLLDYDYTLPVSSLSAQKPLIDYKYKNIPTFTPTSDKYAYDQYDRSYYHKQRIEEGQKQGTYRKGMPDIVFRDLNENYPWLYNNDDKKALQHFEDNKYLSGFYISPNAYIQTGINGIPQTLKYDKIYLRRAIDPETFWHEMDHWSHNYYQNKRTHISNDLQENLLQFINNNGGSTIIANDAKNKNTELGAVFATLKDFTKKEYGDKVTMDDISDDTLNELMEYSNTGYFSTIIPWIKQLSPELKQQLLDWINNPYNVAYNDSKQDKFKERWYPKQQVKMARSGTKIRMGENNLDTDDLNSDDKTYRSNERYAIGVTPTRVALVESYEPGSHDYERYGKTSDIYIGNQGSGSYDQWATKDQQKEADIQEQKRIRNLSGPSAFNPTAATDYFNKAVGTVMSPVITGIKKGYDYIKDIPLTFNTSPSVGLSLPTNAVGRITLSDVTNNPTVSSFGNGLLSVLTPSKDFGFAFSVGDALSSGDFSKIKAPWNPSNYGFATSLDDKMGQAMNTEVDWIIPLAGAPTVASKGEHAINVVRYAQPKYWRYHFRNSMVPSGYGNFKERVGNFIKNIFSGENPIIPGQQPWLIKGTPEYEKYAEALQSYADMMPGFTVDDLIRARQDAINIYSGAPQQFNTFKIIGVGDNGQLKVDMSDKIRKKIIENGLNEDVIKTILSRLKDGSTLEKTYDPFAKTVFPDIFTSAGGNGQYRYHSLKSGTHTPYYMDYDYGTLTFTDKQDYQPFIREGDHVSQRLGLNKKADELTAKSHKLEQEVADKHPEYIEYQINLNEGLIPSVKPNLSMTDKIKLGLSKMYLDAGTKVRKLNNKIDAKMNNFEISSIIPGAKPYDFITVQPITLLSRPKMKYFDMPLDINEKGGKTYGKAFLGFTPVEGYFLPSEVFNYAAINPEVIINEAFNPIIGPIKTTYVK